jgi:hypothetical protein
MKAVMANVPEHILEWRRRTGADQWDEMWEGVLHMAPSPNWSSSAVTGVEMRTAANEKLEIRLAGRTDTQARIP